ncbi:MAG: cysteine--1-D-myo-inosityl 2-amino-2-deoxy-alpha-D-glucopyranoside ligase [Actinomycetes bacterium]
MRAWPAVSVPMLPGVGAPVKVHDSSLGRVVPTAPGRVATLYVCGITPYDATHLGHAATYLAFDLLNRAWRDAGHDVHYVQNVTDVDDPLLERAVATGQDWRELALRETALFRDDMTALRILPPRDYVGAVESIPTVVDYIEELDRRGAVYEIAGDLYFRVSTDPSFGTRSNLSETDMLALFAERGGDPGRIGKEHPLDALLWQRARPAEPAWDSRLGHGRPGWHIECVAIAQSILGATFDVQGGGRDLIFPHHEMCAAQGQVRTASGPFARNYVHAGLVALDGEKMSKSRGNLVFVSKLREAGVDPAAIRLALLNHHYRSDWEWHDSDLPNAIARLERWRRAVAAPTGPAAESTLATVREALSNDLSAPTAVAAIDSWVDSALADHPHEHVDAPGLISRTVDALLGVAL